MTSAAGPARSLSLSEKANGAQGRDSRQRRPQPPCHYRRRAGDRSRRLVGLRPRLVSAQQVRAARRGPRGAPLCPHGRRDGRRHRGRNAGGDVGTDAPDAGPRADADAETNTHTEKQARVWQRARRQTQTHTRTQTDTDTHPAPGHLPSPLAAPGGTPTPYSSVSVKRLHGAGCDSARRGAGPRLRQAPAV